MARQNHTTTGTARRLARRLGGDRGSVTVELAVLFPVFLLVVLSAVQAGMWWHTRNLLLASANAGLQAGRTTTGTATDAQAAASSYLARAGGTAVSHPTVTASVTATTVRVQVSATTLRVLPIPGLDIPATQVAIGAKERFTTAGRP